MGSCFQAYLLLGLLTSCVGTSKSWGLKLTVHVLGYNSSKHPWCQRVGSLQQTWWVLRNAGEEGPGGKRVYFPCSIVGATGTEPREETPPSMNESTFGPHTQWARQVSPPYSSMSDTVFVLFFFTKGRRRRGHKGWDGWMASLTQWTWIWANSRSWRWTGRPGMPQSMGLQLNDWTELNWTE